MFLQKGVYLVVNSKVMALAIAADINIQSYMPIGDMLCHVSLATQIAKFMGPIWGPPGSCRPQMGPLLAPWTLLSG